MRVSVFGLGYVGAVSAACIASEGHSVIGVDKNDTKVGLINAGGSPIVEATVDELIATAHREGRLTATTDSRLAVEGSELSLICVGTPSGSNGNLNLQYVRRVCEEIGDVLKSLDRYHIVVIRSTVLPGTVEKAASVIARESGKQLGRDFGVADNPEFLREGTSVFDFENPPYTVVGGTDETIVNMLAQMYAGISAPFHAVKVREAELLKYACNSFHAVKVTFANEIGAVCKKLGIDSHAVMKIFIEDTKLNISPYYLKPGFAFGGSCLPKDVRAITYEARRLDVAAPLLQSLMPSNDAQIQRTIDWVVHTKRRKIGILGLSFKQDTDDLRESPIVTVVEALIGKGYDLSIYDANVNIARLMGANKTYIEQEIPHISSLMKSSMEEVLEHAEVIVIANKGEGFRHILGKLKPGQMVYDLVRIAEERNTEHGHYEGICW